MTGKNDDITIQNKLLEKISSLEKKNEEYLLRLKILEKQEEANKVQKKLTNAPQIYIQKSYKEWVNTIVLMNKGKFVIAGSKDGSIRSLDWFGEKSDEFIIEKAHDCGVNYILKEDENRIISCGDDGKIKRWYVDCSYSFDTERYRLIETFLINGFSQVHRNAYKIIKLKNGDFCSCGGDYQIKFWRKNNISKKHENYKILKCENNYIKSIMELENNKLIAGGLGFTQFFDIKTFKTETVIEGISVHTPNSMIRMGDKIICSDWGLFFIDIKKQQLLYTIKIEIESEEGIYSLAPLDNRLFICGGNLRTIDIYDITNYEKIASRPVEDEFIFDIKISPEACYFAGSENIFVYENVFREKKIKN